MAHLNNKLEVSSRELGVRPRSRKCEAEITAFYRQLTADKHPKFMASPDSHKLAEPIGGKRSLHFMDMGTETPEAGEGKSLE